MSKDLKDLLIKMVKDMSINMGADLDGDIIQFEGKRYYVDCLNNNVMEV